MVLCTFCLLGVWFATKSSLMHVELLFKDNGKHFSSNKQWCLSNTHTHTHIYIYIYIYIVIHRQICFVLSELVSVATQARFPKLGSKPGSLKRQSKILPLSHEETITSKGNLNGYISLLFFVYIYPLNGYRELDSYKEPCIMLMVTHLLPSLESSTLQW